MTKCCLWRSFVWEMRDAQNVLLTKCCLWRSFKTLIEWELVIYHNKQIQLKKFLQSHPKVIKIYIMIERIWKKFSTQSGFPKFQNSLIARVFYLIKSWSFENFLLLLGFILLACQLLRGLGHIGVLLYNFNSNSLNYRSMQSN